MTKIKLLNLFLIISSLFGYLEWGGNNHSFLFKAEAELISRLFSNASSVVHPFTILPMVGQILLLITLFQQKPRKWLIYTSIACLGLLLGFMFIIGLLSVNIKIIVSTLPFLILSFITIRHLRSSKNS